MVEAYRTLEAELSYQLELVRTKKLLTGSDRIPFGKETYMENVQRAAGSRDSKCNRRALKLEKESGAPSVTPGLKLGPASAGPGGADGSDGSGGAGGPGGAGGEDA